MQVDTTFSTRRTLYNCDLLYTGRKSIAGQVRLRATENLLVTMLISLTVQTEEFANHFVTLKTSRTLDKRENQSLDDPLDYLDKNLGRFNEVSHINFLDAFVDLYDNWIYHHVPLASSWHE